MLLAGVPDGLIVTDPDVVAAFARDQCVVATAGRAIALARPRSTEEVAAVLRAADRAGVPVVPRGAGTGLAGGANAVDGGVIVSLAAMDQIVEIASEDLVAVVQSGVINADLKLAAAEHGLWYPPDPASAGISTIGGNVATNAGGLCCVKYGTTREYVLGVEVVLADGTITRFGRRTRKGVVGLDLTGLVVGSEGTLGIITEVTVQLVPSLAAPRTAVAYYSDIGAAGSAAARLASAGVRPSMLEIMDQATMVAVERYRSCGLDTEMAALVIVQTDLPGEAGASEIERIALVLERNGAAWVGHSDDPADSDDLVAARKLAYPALEHLGSAVLDDVGVPLSKVSQLLRGIRQIADRTGTRIATFGHAGDGNLHPTIIDDDPRLTWQAFGEIVAMAQRLGGTATGEHGVGTLKTSFVAAETDARSMALQQSVKQVFDPAGRMNPGKGLAATPSSFAG